LLVERCGGCVLQQVGVAVKLLIVLMEGRSFSFGWLWRKLNGFWHGFEIVARRCVFQGFYNCFGVCVSKERESILYRVEETEQGELGVQLRSFGLSRIKQGSSF